MVNKFGSFVLEKHVSLCFCVVHRQQLKQSVPKQPGILFGEVIDNPGPKWSVVLSCLLDGRKLPGDYSLTKYERKMICKKLVRL